MSDHNDLKQNEAHSASAQLTNKGVHKCLKDIKHNNKDLSCLQ